MSQEHVPVDRGGVHFLPQPIVAPLADQRVAVIAGLGLGDVADLALADQVVGHQPGGVGHRLDADGHHPVVLDHGIDDGVGLVDGLGHRLLAIDVLAGLGGVDAHLGVPVVGGGDADDIDFFQLEQLAIVLDDVLLVIDVQTDLLRRGIQALGIGPFFRLAAANDGVLARVAVPHVADANRGDLFAFLAQLVDDVQVSLAAAADPQEGHPQTFVGSIDTVVAGGGQGHGTSADGRGLEKVPTIDFGHAMRSSRWRRFQSTPGWAPGRNWQIPVETS